MINPNENPTEIDLDFGFEPAGIKSPDDLDSFLPPSFEPDNNQDKGSKPKKEKKNKLWPVLCGVFGATAAVFAVMTVVSALSGSAGASAQASAADRAEKYVVASDISYDSLGSEIMSLLPNNMKNLTFPVNMIEKMKPVYAASKNAVGILSIPGTEVDTPVMQSNDNSRYLTYNFYEQYTTETSERNYGNIFLDYRCNSDGTPSKNMIIYGHTTGRVTGIPKQAFRSLYDYQDKEHFIDCPIITYTNASGTYKYKICAVFYSTTETSSDGGYLFNYIYPDMSDSNMVGYIEQVKQRMLYETGVSLEPTDKIITLSTCIYVYGSGVDTRLVVVGRMLHDGEDESIDESKVKDNPDYRRPQVWYNSNGKTNPYADSRSWTPSPEN